MPLVPKYLSVDETGVSIAPSAGDLFAIAPVSNTFSFRDFNKNHCITIFTPHLGIERFGENKIAKSIITMTESAAAYAMGVAVDLGLEEDTASAAINTLAETVSQIQNAISGNGESLMFQTYLTQHPNFGISNTYAEDTIVTKLLNKTLGFGVNVARLFGNFNPNYQIAFNFPQVWQESKFQELQFQTQINAFTIDEFKKAYKPSISYSDTSRGVGVMQVALIALAMAAPRVVLKSPEIKSGLVKEFARRVINSPPVIDVIINKIAFRSCFVKEVTVEFGPKHEDGEGIYVDSLGFPLEAKVTWTILIPIAQTQFDLMKTFRQIGAVSSLETQKTKYANFSSYTLRSDDFIRKQFAQTPSKQPDVSFTGGGGGW